jgi:hypothetical protein
LILFEGLLMNDERTATRVPALGRWILVAAVIAAGLILYFMYAPTTEPAAPVSAAAGR